MANKQKRIAALIQRNISDIILFELKNPLMKLVSVNYVDVSGDDSLAKVYVTHLEKHKSNEAVETLNRLKGVIRSSLAKKLDIYRTPELVFILDDTYDKGAHIEELLKNINKY